MKVIIDGIEYVPVGRDEIKVGDRVKVVDSGKFYTLFDEWDGWMNLHIRYVSRYQYDATTSNLEGKIANVVYIGPHSTRVKNMLAVIMMASGKCYLIDVDGLEKVGGEQLEAL